jgi:hypothetical protein
LRGNQVIPDTHYRARTKKKVSLYVLHNIFDPHFLSLFFFTPGWCDPTPNPPTDLKSSLLPLSKVRSLNNQMVACWSTEKRIEGGSPTLIWHSSLKIKSFRYVKRICQKRSQRSNRRRKFIGPSRDCNVFSRS